MQPAEPRLEATVPPRKAQARRPAGPGRARGSRAPCSGASGTRADFPDLARGPELNKGSPQIRKGVNGGNLSFSSSPVGGRDGVRSAPCGAQGPTSPSRDLQLVYKTPGQQNSVVWDILLLPVRTGPAEDTVWAHFNCGSECVELNFSSHLFLRRKTIGGPLSPGSGTCFALFGYSWLGPDSDVTKSQTDQRQLIEARNSPAKVWLLNP